MLTLCGAELVAGAGGPLQQSEQLPACRPAARRRAEEERAERRDLRRPVEQPRQSAARTTPRPDRRSGSRPTARSTRSSRTVGTGGTLAGTSTFLREMKKDIVIGCADPRGAAMYNLFAHGEAKATEGGSITEGIGLGRVTPIIEDIKCEKAYLIPRRGGDPVSSSICSSTKGFASAARSAINIAGAVRLAKDLGPGKTIVTLLCDSGTRYQSKLYNPDFLRSKKLPVPEWLEREIEHQAAVCVKRELHADRLPVPRRRLSHLDARDRARPHREGRHRGRPHLLLRDLGRPAGRQRRAGDAGRRISARDRGLQRSAQDRDRACAGRRRERTAGGRRQRHARSSTGVRAIAACACTRRCISSPPCCPIR